MPIRLAFSVALTALHARSFSGSGSSNVKNAAARLVTVPESPAAPAVPPSAPTNAVPFVIPTVSSDTPDRVAVPGTVPSLYVTPTVDDVVVTAPLKDTKPPMFSSAVASEMLPVTLPVPNVNTSFAVPPTRFSVSVYAIHSVGPVRTVPALTPSSSQTSLALGPVRVSLPAPPANVQPPRRTWITSESSSSSPCTVIVPVNVPGSDAIVIVSLPAPAEMVRAVTD